MLEPLRQGSASCKEGARLLRANLPFEVSRSPELPDTKGDESSSHVPFR